MGRKINDTHKLLEDIRPQDLDILPLEEFTGNFDSPDPVELEKESDSFLEQELERILPIPNRIEKTTSRD